MPVPQPIAHAVEGMTVSPAQPKKPTASKIDELMESASEALAATRYFEADALARQALKLAHEARDYDRMARIILPLQEARRHKRQLAIDTGKVVTIDSYDLVEKYAMGKKKFASGCYLAEPPLVGADGRDLRDKLDELGMPAIVIVREPQTQLGLWPVVMIGPVTVRTKVRPPSKKIDIKWLLAASEALGDEAISTVDARQPASVRVDQLMDRLATIVDHEKLFQALADTCREAEREAAEDAKRPRRAPAKAAAEEEDDGFGEFEEEEL